LVSLFGSIAVGALLCRFGTDRVWFALVPIWLFVRMACVTIDGTLAIDFGQKNRLGGILNEAGDIISDVALVFPLVVVTPFPVVSVLVLIPLIILCELAGISGQVLGGGRRQEGPLGKADRAIVFAALALTIAVFGRLPPAPDCTTPFASPALLRTTLDIVPALFLLAISHACSA
jgi:CDP-diacylglycerol--glycerol-3-phosphate 3-phosphatidyltransferase